MLNTVERSSGVRNAAILLVLGGLLLIYSGSMVYYYSIVTPYAFSPIFGIFNILLGIVSLCTSLLVWLQKPWVVQMIAGIGIVVCAAHIIFGYYLVVVFYAPWYWAAYDYVQQKPAAQSSVWDDIYTE